MKLRYIFYFFLTLSVLSCSEDDPEPTTVDTSQFVGIWQLTAINVSSGIDVNNDGMVSTNLLDEVECLEGTLNLLENATWTASTVNVQLISPITGNLYNVSCTANENTNGNWGVEGGQLFLVVNTSRPFAINGNRLTETLDQDLPGIQSIVYEKQE